MNGEKVNRTNRTVLESIDDAIKTGTTHLDLSAHPEELNLEQVLKQLEVLPRIESLVLDANNIQFLPHELGRLKHLRRLCLNRNKLINLPESLVHLTGLETLELGGNQITSLPAWLSQFIKLRTLDISNNRLTALPESVIHLRRLESLAIDGNEITSLPDTLSRLTRLRKLALTRNHLVSLPEGLGELKFLEVLEARENKIRDIPHSLCMLPQLRRLWLGENMLTAVPREIRNLTTLRELDLDANVISNLPAELWELTELRFLDLDDIRLSQVPPAIQNLRKLEELFLKRNLLRVLPPEIGQLKDLKRLEVSDNPLPAEILRLAENDNLLPYLRGLAKANLSGSASPPPRPFNEAKLLLVGPGEVGKSWLLQALQGRVPKRTGSTKGLEIAREPIELRHPAENDRLIHVNCWDFGGQDNYQITHQIFFSPKAIYLLVWKPRPGVDPDLLARLERIQLSAGRTAKVFIVSTHADDNVPAAIGKDVIRERFGDLIWGFYDVDSGKGKSGTGIAELKREIAKAAAQLEGMDTPFLSAWHEVHKSVRRITKPTINFEEFELVCKKHGVASGDADALASIMDVQGNAVYFADAPSSGNSGVAQSENLIVLDPEWLAKAVAFVIEDKETRENSGVLLHNRLSKIWAKDINRGCPGYSETLHGYLLWLMWKFDIAYKQNEHTSLLPELIHRNRPDDLRWTPTVPANESQATLICRIPQDPPTGLIPVLTAAVHPLRRVQNPAHAADQLDRNWRDGFFLDTALRGTAFVELLDRDLTITVRDRYPSDLVRQVRRTLERVAISRWPRLKLDHRVPCIGQIEEKPCPGTFRLDYLEMRRHKVVSCQHCNSDELEVEKMLEGFDANAAAVLRQLQQLKAGQMDLMAVALRIYRDVLDPAREELERAPCMFTILPETGRSWNVFSKATENQFRVTCWCEHPDGPHPGVPIGSDNPPDYVIKVTKTWLLKVAPYISWAATLLKAFVPMAGTIVKQGLDDALVTGLKDRIDLMSEASKALPTGKLEVGPDDKIEDMHRSRPEIVALRHLHDALLKQVPESKRWGDLRAVRTKTGELLWLCAEHAAIQQPPLQKI